MKFNKKWFYYFLCTKIIVLCVVFFYLKGNYLYLKSPVSSIEITYTGDIQPQGLTMYVLGKTEVKLNYTRPYKFKQLQNNVLFVKFDDTLKLRSFRIYFEHPKDKIVINSIDLISTKDKYSINLNENVNIEGLKLLTKSKENYGLEVMKLNGFLDFPKQFLYKSDFNSLYKLCLPLLFVILISTYLVYRLKKLNFKGIGFSEVTFAILIFTVFLPAPIYNVALILMVLLNLKNMSWTTIKSQAINLLVVGFFLVYLLNNLFVSSEGFHQMGTIERFLPFVILGVVLPSISNRRYLSLFPVSAFVIGFVFLVTSIFDVYIHQNLDFLSFDHFTKYLNPVYFSYLLFFSICYVDITIKSRKKYLYEIVLFLFLIFSGSKIVFIFSLIVVLIGLVNNWRAMSAVIPLVIFAILFSPLKHRFQDVLKKEDLSILKEKHIENANDPRINGLTFRLILWREAFATMHGVDYILGKGVTQKTNKFLEDRLTRLGLLKHKKYNPHNQYVDTFWRTGVIGLLFLILIPVYSLIVGIKKKDRLIILFTLFMIVVMSSESIFGRVNGIYFFTTVVLILMNTIKKNEYENSHIRNERHTK